MYFLSIVCSPLFALCCLSVVCCLLFGVCCLCSARTEALPLCNTGGLTSFNGAVTRTTHYLHLMSTTTNPILLPSPTNKYSLTRKHAHTHAHTYTHTDTHTDTHRRIRLQIHQSKNPKIFSPMLPYQASFGKRPTFPHFCTDLSCICLCSYFLFMTVLLVKIPVVS
jgi:hypothetical protein